MSIKKIAEKAGVSISTVSRILNRPDYKCSVPGLREKVWSIAMEMNYVPNEAARNLKKGTQAKESKIWYINVLMTRTDEYFGICTSDESDWLLKIEREGKI